jgi:perosamine synthetase
VRALRKLVGERVAIIEDCAHATGGTYYGKKIGSEGNLACFSFQAVKNLATGDGGALVTDDQNAADRAKRLRWLGIDRDTWTRTEANRQYWWRYNVTEVGQKSHMNDITAAIGLVQLAKLDAMNARRREIVRLYNQQLAGVVETPPADDEQRGFRSAWHIYCIRTAQRDDLAVHLQQHGVSTGVHYFPLHLYENIYGRQAPLPVAEREWTRMMSLPIFPDLGDDQVTRVCQLIRKFYA